MTPIRVAAHAKVNLLLLVHGKRPDGFHELSTVMHGIDLSDDLEIAPAAATDILCDDPTVPTDHRNTVAKALDLLRREIPGLGHVRVAMRKRIPSGGGLAGGSADAVVAARAVAETVPGLAPAGREAILARVAGRIGSDTVFFLSGGTALCTGRGEQVEPLPHRRLFFNLILPPFPCLTPAVYGAFRLSQRSATDRDSWLADWRAGLLPRVVNDLEAACAAAYPEMGRLLDRFRERGLPVRLSGSGSTLFTVSADAAGRDRLAAALRPALPPDCRLLAAASRWPDSRSA